MGSRKKYDVNKDIRQHGPYTYLELLRANASKYGNLSPLYGLAAKRNVRPINIDDTPVGFTKSNLMNVSDTGEIKDYWGNSSYDTNKTTIGEFENVGDVRAENQPWYALIGAGLAKGAILAGTTFLDGTIGLITGIGTAIDEGRWSGLWDNDFSKAMKSINEWSEEALPNYYTKLELEGPWYENIFTSNFLGDKFIKNLGFTIGAFYSGGLESKAIQGLGALAKNIATGTKAVKAITGATDFTASVIGSLSSAVNEGRIEALNNSTDWYKLKVLQLNDLFLDYELKIEDEYEQNKGKLIRTSDGNYIDPAQYKYEQDIINLENARELALARLNEDRLKMGNADLLMNLPILTASNILQFGKLYANGFKTAKKGINIVGNPGKYTPGTSKVITAANSIKGALSEGTEEISQSAASRIAGNYYSTDIDNFVKAKLDPLASLETLSWTKAFALGINETVNDGSAWEEFFIGSLTGALGMPRFRGFKDKLGNIQSPVTLEGGLFNEYRETVKARQRELEVADKLNERFASPEFRNYYLGLIRHKKYQNDMDDAVLRDDPFDFHNAEHALMVSDIIMFDNAGKLLDLQELIDSSYNISDDNLASIVKNTTSQTEDGKTVGPFIDDNGNPKYATLQGKKEMIKEITDTKDAMTKAIKDYQESKESILARLPSGVDITDDLLEELVWMKSQINNWGDRAVSMSGLIKESIGKVIGSLEGTASILTDLRTEEGKSNADLTPTYKLLDANIKDIRKAINTLDSIRNLSDEVLANKLSNNPDFVKGLIQEIDRLDEEHMNKEDKNDVKLKLNDIIRLGNGQKEYLKKYEEYIINPYLLANNHLDLIRKAEKDEQRAKTKGLRTNLSLAKNLSEFKLALNNDNELEDTEKLEVIKELVDTGNKVAKDYTDTEEYARQVRRKLADDTSIDNSVFNDSMKLFLNHLLNANNLLEISNTESVHLNDDTIFEDDSPDIDQSQSRFAAALLAIQNAMQKVNESANFKNRFVDPEEKPKDLPKESPKPEKDISQTSSDIEVGDISFDDVIEENKVLNESNYDNPEDLGTNTNNKESRIKNYWKPVIPELHIDGSREGDFRPFNVVVKKREPGVDFDIIYNHLQKNGAFEYVNLGKLHPLDTIYFLIDPTFEKQVEGKSWHKEPTIFIAVKEGNKEDGRIQIVGSLNEGDSVLNFIGLDRIEKIIIDEYKKNRSKQDSSKDITDNPILRKASDEFKEKVKNPDNWETIDINSLSYEELNALDDAFMAILDDTSKHPTDIVEKAKKGRSEEFVDKLNNTNREYYDLTHGSTTQNSDIFIGSPKTRVSLIMIGKVPTTNEDKNLADIPNINGRDNNTLPIFGIIKNGTMTTNGKVAANKVINPVDMSNKEGRLYLLIPNAAGMYSPMAVRVKHFNKDEFDLNDSTINSTPIGKDINKALDDLANSRSSDDIQDPKKTLADNIYMRDVMITWFTNDSGSGIVISKKVRDANGHPVMVTINGQEHIKEDKTSIWFTKRAKVSFPLGFSVDLSAFETWGINSSLLEFDDPAVIKQLIVNVLMGYNLPILVSARKLNSVGYGNRLLNSNILSSNIERAESISSWFTMDYIDENGNIQSALNPPSVLSSINSPLNAPEAGEERGYNNTVSVNIGTNNFEVNLELAKIRLNGKWRDATNADLLIIDIAWAQNLYGDNKNGLFMHNNCVVTPEGLVLDRTTLKYLEGEEAQRIKDILDGKAKTKAEIDRRTNVIISRINENQKRVDRSRTSSDSYFILEEDGNYYAYDRVHKRIGDNYKLSDRQKGALTSIRNTLQEKANNQAQFNIYIDDLSNKWGIDLSQYKDDTSATNRNKIVEAIDLKMRTPNQDTLDAGQSVDTIVRLYFIVDDVSKILKPDNLSLEAFNSLMDRLAVIKLLIDINGWRFLTNNIVLFLKYPDGSRVAGEVDILAIDSQGNFMIFDIKTSKYAFGPDTNKRGKKVNYFENPAPTMVMSSKDYYTLQLSAYKNLFESLYLERIVKLVLIPFKLIYNENDSKMIDNIESLENVILQYNPSVNVPLVGNISNALAQTLKLLESSLLRLNLSAPLKSNLSIFGNHINLNPKDLTYDYNKFTTTENNPGYYVVNNEVRRNHLTKATEIDGIPIYITREGQATKGFGNNEAHVALFDYYAVFPNGKAMLIMKGVSDSVQPENVCIDKIVTALKNNPTKVKSLSSELTSISGNDITTAQLNETQPNSQTQNGANPNSTLGGISKASPATKRTRPRLRETTKLNVPIWNRDKELAKLREMLPLLSRSDSIRIINDLIKVAENGATAWGLMDNGLITLSDVAAEGTAYHEAFHLVFLHMMNNADRLSILNEAREKYGEHLSDLELEEELAEDFREFVMSEGKDTRSLGRKIIDFFKSLFAMASNWSKIRPSNMYYFRAIYNGKYANKEISRNITSIRYQEEKYTPEMLNILTHAPRDELGRLLAPNGKPSNLTERQYAHVRTKAFREWFGDWINDPENASKVVDENGEPLVVYHSSPNIFNTFELEKSPNGFYFGTREQAFARSDMEVDYHPTGQMVQAFLNIKNPKITNFDDRNIQKYKDTNDGFIIEVSREDAEELAKIGDYNPDNFRKEYVTFNPNQIKSATDNVGTYSRNNNDIRYRRVVGDIIQKWDLLDKERKRLLEKLEWSEEYFNRISQRERDLIIKCLA